MRLTRVVTTIVLALFAVPAAAVAQRYWHDDQGRDAFRLDIGFPFLKGDNHKFFTGTLVPSLSLRAGDGFRVEADVPISRAATDGESSLRLGNPYLGLRIGEDEKPISGILGARFPISKQPTSALAARAVEAGTIADIDDAEAYLPNMLAFRGGLEYQRTRSSGLLVGARGVLALQMNTGGDPTADSEASFDYGFRLGYSGARALATVALTGRYLITAPHHNSPCLDPLAECDPKSFSERTHNQLAGMLELRGGRLRPRVTLRVPLDEALRDVAGAILGIGFSLAK